jgi:hypothetical protein
MGMCPAPRALEIRREDANRPTTAPGSSPDRARPPLGKASRRRMTCRSLDDFGRTTFVLNPNKCGVGLSVATQPFFAAHAQGNSRYAT